MASIKDFLVAGLGGIRDQFTGITPQDRFKMDQEQRKFEEQQRQAQEDAELQRNQMAAIESFRTESLKDRDEDRAMRSEHFNETQARLAKAAEEARIRFNQTQEAADRRHNDILGATNKRHAETLEHRDADREDRQSFQEERDKQKAVSAASVSAFNPGFNLTHFTTKSNKFGQEETVPLAEAKKAYAEAYQAAFEVWKNGQRGLAGQDPEVDAEVTRDQEVETARAEAEEPGASQEEIDEAESKRLQAIAEFGQHFDTKFGTERESLSAGGSVNPREVFSGSPGAGSNEPVFLERPSGEETKQEDSKREISQFRQLVEQVAAGDGEAAQQLGDMTSPEKLRGFKLFEEQYGPEALTQLRLIYRQELGIDPPF